MRLIGRYRELELKWLLIGLLIGTAVGYAQGSGMVDATRLLTLLPI